MVSHLCARAVQCTTAEGNSTIYGSEVTRSRSGSSGTVEAGYGRSHNPITGLGWVQLVTFNDDADWLLRVPSLRVYAPLRFWNIGGPCGHAASSERACESTLTASAGIYS